MDWYYYSDNGEKIGPFKVKEIRDHVKNGIIQKNTILENANGRSAAAGTIKGLDFPPETIPVPPIESEHNQKSQQSSNIFCRQCGSELPSNSKFCSSCGKSTDEKLYSNNTPYIPITTRRLH